MNQSRWERISRERDHKPDTGRAICENEHEKSKKQKQLKGLGEKSQRGAKRSGVTAQRE
jgi:hypothetical protein